MSKIDEIIEKYLNERDDFNNLRKGDLVFAKDIGMRGLVGLVISNIEHDYEEDLPYIVVYFRGLGNDNIQQIYSDENVVKITDRNIHLATKNADIGAYQSIAKRQRLPFNLDYLDMELDY